MQIYLNAVRDTELTRRTGRVLGISGQSIEAAGPDASIGEVCEVQLASAGPGLLAEVVGVKPGRIVLMPYGDTRGIGAGSRVVASGQPPGMQVGDGLLGRVIDAFGVPLDGGVAPVAVEVRSLFAPPINPLTRPRIHQLLETGVRAIDTLLPLGRGQRMGIFAGSGVGKSTLLGMLARDVHADVNVIALIGERGREVREFIEAILGDEGMARSVVVCATSDRSAIERAKAAYVATAVAEYFRDRDQKVLLMMDSLTRFARALREIGLARGEPPTRRGFPPSVFAEIPRLLERAGMGRIGSITALYTVLTEDDSGGDPIAEEVRGILDGHMILSRKIAARNQYPAIDVLGSLSRLMSQIVPQEHADAAGHVRKLMAKYDDVETLLQLGEYTPGNDAVADEAIASKDSIRDFLNQRTDTLCPFVQTVDQLRELAP